MYKLGYWNRRAAVVGVLSLVAGAAGVWSQAVATSNETTRMTSEALHAGFDNPQTGEHVWIQSDEAVMNSSNVPGGPQVGNAWILADAWNPKGFGSHSLQFTADTHSLSNYPRFEANQNNGKSWPNDQNYPPVVAHQTIFLGGTDASSIIVPEVAGTAGQ